MEGKTNFFEKRVSEYSLSMRNESKSGSGDSQEEEGGFDEDF